MGAFVAIAADCSSVLASANKKRKPNLVFVFPDEMRGTAMGFLGKEPVLTPNLDALAKESLVLSEAVSNYPVCVPYRTILMTGKYPISNGVHCNCFADGRDLPDHHVWWTDLLKQDGYALSYFGKWHITLPIKEYQGRKLNSGQQVWLPPEKRHGLDTWHIHANNNHMNNTYVFSDKMPWDARQIKQWTPEYETDRALEYLKNEGNEFRQPDQPFAMVISWNPPHTPYGQVPEKYVEQYKDFDSLKYSDTLKNLPPAGTKRGDSFRRNIKKYYAAITGCDDQLGRILKCLKEQNLDEDTILVFTSDHGETMGALHDHWDHKNTPWEESMRIPFIIRWPGRIKARTDDLLLSVGDVYPTLMELMNVEQQVPERLEGDSYAKLFLGGKQKRPTSQLYMFIEERNGNPLYGRRGVRTHRYTLSIERTVKEEIKWVLYDNQTDPFQLENISEANPGIIKKLIEDELKPWLAKTKDPFEIPSLEV